MGNQRSFSFIVFWFVILSVTHHGLSQSDTSVLSPATLEDGVGNRANENSDITFAPLINNGSVGNIQCSGCVGDDGIRSYLDTSKKFAQAVIPGSFQYKWVDRASDGDLKVDDYEEIINDHIGLVICIGVGLVFIIVFPIVGICFCCCRCCCGKCGGNRWTDGSVKRSCHRPCFMVSLSILSILVGVGGILALLTNNYVSDGIDSFHDDVPTNLDSVLDFVKDSVDALDDIATNDFNFTKDVIFRDLDNIGFLLGGNVKANLESRINLDDIKRSVTSIESALANLLVIVPRINDQISNVSRDINAYAAAMTEIDRNYTSRVSGSTSPGLNQTVDSNQIPELANVTDLQNVQNANLTGLLNDALKEIDEIPERVQNNSKTPVADLKSSVNDYTSDVTDVTDDLDIDKEINRDSIKDDVQDFTDEVKKYNKYRWYAGLALGLIVVVMSIFLGLGLLLGCVGGDGSTPPHKRGGLSNCGGNLLLIGCIIFFIFGTFLMLITTLLFTLGAPIEDYGCVALNDPAVIDRLIDEYEIIEKKKGSGNYFGDKILDDPNKNLTLTEILNNCENSQAIYTALRMNESTRINLTDILDYRSKFSVEERISTINVDFGDINLLTPSFQNNIQTLNDSIQYNITQYESELNQDVTKSATDFQDVLRGSYSSASPTEQVIYNETISAIQRVVDNEGEQLRQSVEALKTRITELDGILHPTSQPSLSDDITTLETQLKDLDANIPVYGNDSLSNGVRSFSDRLFRVTDSFIDHLLDSLHNDLGKCYPIYNFYKSLLKDNLCGTLIDSVNGFWFSLGWSIFFMMPSLVIAIKLSSHFRTMQLNDSSNEFLDTHELKFKPENNGPPQYIKPNKVNPH